MRVIEVVVLARASSSRLRWRVTGSAVRAASSRLPISARIRCWVGEQGGDVVPDDGVEVVGADRLVAADPAALVAVVVGAQAPVVVDLLVGGAGRGAVVAVAAARAGGQALQQRRDLAVAGGEPLVVVQPLGDPVEGRSV